MKIVVAGDGKVGLDITRLLSQEGHDIVTIDTNREVLEENLQQYDVMTVVGNSATMSTLKDAGVETADLFIAATSADEINILSCITARKMNPFLHTIARVRNPEYTEQLFMMRSDLGLSMIINPERDGAQEIFRLLQIPGVLKRETFAKGRVEIVEIRIPEKSVLDGIYLDQLSHVLKGRKVLVCVVSRNGKAFIPTSDTMLRAGDHIYVTAPVAILSYLLKKLDITQKKIRHAMIIGGGRVSYYLVKNLVDAGVKVKIIEKDFERCEHLAEILPEEASIIFADGSSQEVLDSEGIAEMDAVITLTGVDEQNVIASMYSSSKGVPHVVTKINRTEMAGMIENLSIGSMVSPKDLCSANVVQYVRAMQNQSGAAVTMHRIANGRAETLEFVVNESSRYLGEPLKKIKLKKHTLISCITHKGKTVIPDGDSSFQIGDTVVVVTNREDPILQFNDIFA